MPSLYSLAATTSGAMAAVRSPLVLSTIGSAPAAMTPRDGQHTIATTATAMGTTTAATTTARKRGEPKTWGSRGSSNRRAARRCHALEPKARQHLIGDRGPRSSHGKRATRPLPPDAKHCHSGLAHPAALKARSWSQATNADESGGHAPQGPSSSSPSSQVRPVSSITTAGCMQGIRLMRAY
jgi:hypothetical protein